jgi:DNA (cytosine-5)-methyltransferase 1
MKPNVPDPTRTAPMQTSATTDEEAPPVVAEPQAPHVVAGLFSGIGGFELGLSRSGHRTAMMCEIWEPAAEVLRQRFPDIPIVPDVVELANGASRVPDEVTLLTAGFPCTDLSQAGMTAGIKGENSGLIYQVFRLLHMRAGAGKPIPWLVIENVPNMLHLARGEAMDVIVTELERMGYKWAYRVINSLAFGVPQRRRRVFLVASLDDDPRRVVLSDDAGAPDEPKKLDWTLGTGVGFYWTEGLRGIGWAHEAVPTLKGGSTVGVSSSPGIVLPDGRVVKPNIRDAERMQGFEAGWTKPAERVAKPGYRWKLVGNAVTVDVAEWLGSKLRHPADYDGSADAPLPKGSKWPKAAWNIDGTRMRATVSEYPQQCARPPLHEFLKSEPDLLSYRATRGFLNRATSDKCNLRFPPGFLDVVRAHLDRVETGT